MSFKGYQAQMLPFSSAFEVAIHSSWVDFKSDVGTITWWHFAWVDFLYDWLVSDNKNLWGTRL